ncbi:carbohydrate kinase family protein [Roseomonas sp. BN140053]|uniref:carbohydrate kinase family protein n=1 Tax=Roseomonas sp. BN140053 TaxID=3391898 RepID=UPI0039EA9AF4
MVEAFAAGGMIVDNVVAADGTVRTGSMGGNAVYAAAGMRVWLDRVGIVALVPRNYPPAFLEALAAAGIDTAGLRVMPEDVDRSEWFFYRPDGSRVDGLHAAEGALARHGLHPGRLTPNEARRFEAQLRDAPEAGRSFGAFRREHPVQPEHLPHSFRAARSAHLGPNRADAAFALATALRRPGFRLTLDPGGQAAALLPLLPELLPRLDAILPSEKELAVLVPERPAEAALAALRAGGVPVAAVKRGGRGALLDAGQPVAVPALPVRAVDPTGAGDAWCGGFLAGWLRSGDPLLAACCGTVSASFAVEAFGPLHLLRVDHAAALARLEQLLALLPPGTAPRNIDLLRSGTITA